MMRVAIVGQGSLGRALAQALRRAGVSARGYRARARTPVLVHEVVIVAVRDELISDVALRLRLAPHAAVLHCAGAYSAADLLGPMAARVREIGKLHPLLSVAGRVDFRGVVFAVEGRMASLLARRLGGVPVVLRPQAAPLYHAAAVLAAGHVATVLDAATETARCAGLPERAARRALCSLARSAIANFERAGLRDGLTGPFARGDAAVVARHLAALPRVDRELYRLIGARSLLRSRVSRRDRQRLQLLLNKK